MNLLATKKACSAAALADDARAGKAPGCEDRAQACPLFFDPLPRRGGVAGVGSSFSHLNSYGPLSKSQLSHRDPALLSIKICLPAYA